QPGGVGVESPDGIQALAGGNELDDGLAALRVARGGDDALGLVERVREPLMALGVHGPAVDEHGARVVDVARGVGDDGAVDLHAAGGDDRLGGAAGGDTGVGEVLGKSQGAVTIGGVDLALLDETLADEPAFRARQVWRWAAAGASGYDAMTDVP